MDKDRLTAEYRNGTLEITAPLPTVALPRKVEIKALYRAIVDRFRVMVPFLQFLTGSFTAKPKKLNALAMFA